MRSRLYLGQVVHARLEPVEHSFRYPAFAFALDVDELPELDRRLRFFGHGRRALFSLYEADYLGGDDRGLRAKLGDRIAAAGTRIDLSRVELVTTPRFAGHTFNPVSFYYCYDAGEQLSGIVAEVNNTFGEGHVYVLPASAAASSTESGLSFATPKSFHVSPFNDMRGTYEFHFAALAEHLDVRIDIRREAGRSFASRLRGTARPLDNASLYRLAATYPLTTALTLPRIMWQAYKLHYRKGLPLFDKPEPASPQTFAAARPAYISELSAPSWLRPEPTETEIEDRHGSH